LLRIGQRVEFAHPLVRTAAYCTAAAADRERVHCALAEATNAARASASIIVSLPTGVPVPAYQAARRAGKTHWPRRQLIP